uniref:Nuclear envelope membrane protein n=1 Tax=Culicoides sonorensis TaxID=179676 RepID=A0A336KTU6_CULSO
MSALQNLVLLLIGITSFVFTFVSIGKLAWFLSAVYQTKVENENLSTGDQVKEILSNKLVLNALFVDASLAILFIFVHSFFRMDSVKGFWAKIGLKSAVRSIYCLVSALSLLFLLKHWKIVPYSFWEFDIYTTNFRYWCFFLAHSLAWTIIYAGSLLMDLPELLGIKQIVYHLQGLPHPCEYYKSEQLNTLYSHIRHPSFICLTLILWGANCMTFDRFILASLWTLYMFLAWNPDSKDYEYQKIQLTRKKLELNQQTTMQQRVYW